MSEEKKARIVNEALEKAYSALENTDELDMASGDFLNLLCAIDHLEYLSRGEAPIQAVTSEAQDPAEPAAAEEGETATTEEPEGAEETSTYTLAEVKAALLAARKKGTNVAALIRSVGGEDINTVPPSRYGELMGMLDEGAAHAS